MFIFRSFVAWLNEIAWDNITELDKLQGFHGVIDSFEQYSRDWYNWYTHTEPETLPLIGAYSNSCKKLLIGANWVDSRRMGWNLQ